MVEFIREGMTKLFQNCGKRIKGHVCLYEYFSLFGLETHFITKFPYFFGLLKLIWGAIHALKMYEILFCSKYTKKLPKNSNLLQSVRMTMGVLSPPPTTVHCTTIFAISSRFPIYLTLYIFPCYIYTTFLNIYVKHVGQFYAFDLRF